MRRHYSGLSWFFLILSDTPDPCSRNPLAAKLRLGTGDAATQVDDRHVLGLGQFQRPFARIFERVAGEAAGRLAIRIKALSGHYELLPDRRLLYDFNENKPLQIGRLLALGQLLEVRHRSLLLGALTAIIHRSQRSR